MADSEYRQDDYYQKQSGPASELAARSINDIPDAELEHEWGNREPRPDCTFPEDRELWRKQEKARQEEFLRKVRRLLDERDNRDVIVAWLRLLGLGSYCHAGSIECQNKALMILRDIREARQTAARDILARLFEANGD